VDVSIGIAIILLSYLLGSIPSAYLAGRLWGKGDLRSEGDGHISATAVYRKVGLIPFILVMLTDAGKGILSVYLTRLFSDSQIVLILAGYAAVIGHCWSVYLGFKGGLGGLILFSVLVSIAFKEAWIAAGVALVLLLTTRKSSWSTYILVGATSVVLLVERESLVIALFPLGLMMIHYIKRFQTQRANPRTAYKHEVFDDLKRIR
jgi:acyl phosphate:glycerol-3-phosphate acyltransferase